jgi:hypothetical protein
MPQQLVCCVGMLANAAGEQVACPPDDQYLTIIIGHAHACLISHFKNTAYQWIGANQWGLWETIHSKYVHTQQQN